jgi:hypothetical protein
MDARIRYLGYSRRAASIGLLAALLIASFGVNAEVISDIASTRHNLSVSGTGTATAVSESQICVFCHTPHRAAAIPEAPLWKAAAPSCVYPVTTVPSPSARST